MKNSKFLFLFISLILFTNFINAQITVTNSNQIASQFVTSIALPYTVPAGSDRLLLVAVGSDQIPSTVTFAGTPMIPEGGVNTWILVLGSNIVSGTTGNIVFTIAGITPANFIAINAISFTGVDQTTPVDNYLQVPVPISAVSSDLIITSRVDDLVFDGVFVGCTTPLAGGGCITPPVADPDVGQVLRNDLDFLGTGFNAKGGTSTKVGASSVPVGWNFSGSVISPFPGIHVGVNIRNVLTLPVELSSFTVRKRNDNIAVAWETQSETNNESFDIERSEDGRIFKKIGNIKGEGSTAQSQQYEFVDKNPTTGLLYYRLKQIDFDGAFEYSPIKTINVNKTGFKIFPNPVVDQLNIEWSMNGQAMMSIFDQTGRLVKQLELKEGQQGIDISDLPNGVYMVKIKTQNQLLVEKLIKWSAKTE